jgi:flavin-dependent dehydrogenase
MRLRYQNLRRLSSDSFDVLIVGGGGNGAAAAAALASKGVKTALVDRGDFAGFTTRRTWWGVGSSTWRTMTARWSETVVRAAIS